MALPVSGPLSLNDIQTEFGGTNPIGMNEYYAGGGLVPAGTSGTYGAVPSSGTISIQNFYGTSNYVPVYVEELFQTWLYTGTGATQTITNGINLSTNGGLVWLKERSSTGNNPAHWLFDTNRGTNASLSSNSTANQTVWGGSPTGIAPISTTGFSVTNIQFNTASSTYVSWTFRKQPKFFDVVTYTGDGTAGRAISHNLGSVPGCVIVKRTDSSANWVVWHRSLSNPSKFLILDSTAAEGTDVNGPWGPFSSGYTTNASAFTSTVFRVANDTRSNASGGTYVAYLFAHDAGGFGAAGTDNVITCGSLTTDGSGNATVTLGYEPQWVMVKATSQAGDWIMQDVMRNMSVSTSGSWLYANTSNAELTSSSILRPTATGFVSAQGNLSTNTAYIYIAIRRGPMKTPTTGTSVFSPVTYSGNGVDGRKINVGINPDALWDASRNDINLLMSDVDRLRGNNNTLTFSFISPEGGTSTYGFGMVGFDNNNINVDVSGSANSVGTNYISYSFRRAPGFFDVVCYTGNGSNSTTVTHNLSVAPELIIAKARNAATAWRVGAQFTSTTRIAGTINTSDSLPSDFYTGTGATLWTGQPTATTFTPGLTANGSGTTYVAYLFATVAGVSKVGSYTGNGSSQTINCGFTAGTRFFLVKRTDSTGNWWVFDTARGISAFGDPALALNVTSSELSPDALSPQSSGVTVIQEGQANINVNGGTYIFLAIA